MSFKVVPREQDVMTDNNRHTMPWQFWYEDLVRRGITADAPVFTGGMVYNETTITENTTLAVGNHIVYCDTDGGGFTVTLPAIVSGTNYIIKNSGTSGNDVTLEVTGTDILFGVSGGSESIYDMETVDLIGSTTQGWM